MGLETSQKPKFSIADGWYSAAFRLEEKSGDFQSSNPMTNHSPSAQTVFERTAATYDAARAKLIPPYERFYSTAVDLIPFEPTAEIRILDLGAGTGLLSAFIREKFPNAQLHLIDIAETKLDRAKTRLGTRRTTYAASDYGSQPIPLPIDGQWDAIVSALSIHHLNDSDKRGLFRRVHAALAPGGVFVNAEQVAGPTPDLTRRYHQQWLAQIRERGASEQEIADAEYRMQADQCASVEDQLAWIRAAGFEDADCWFKEGHFAVMAGTRTGQR
ncbi:MAG: class I SAM-dependent methyltransferase [Silvibacterium sp.]